ncbi:hypothetical protein D9756_003444 [Leucocoprinus leucothites]|uniref:Uncharacterized protein n=1 Tax=Leucocoprinus leucothites TaxID=201217 RepID=A0A8H5G7Q0_9AGAR|nr:hypothetical protein D9756_003444 [Leucoagaricus leucothites]
MNNILSSVASITTGNSALQPSLPVAERADIHKSCKSLEILLNVLNDYCEAATAIVTLQKKLAKALRETAGSKVTNETAGNALNASAHIFETRAEVDAKFVKIADKEYDTISTEVKRWFKKLAKEEKAHDERIANANAKIKQAGANFEKKSRKKSIDAQDEHSRYIHLISTLGPEITQEKYNHLNQTTQRHTTTIYSVAACLSRIADTEWVRSCECVRRFAPTVGPLGEWRSLCEGGWSKDIPGDLVNLDEKPQDNLRLNTIKERVEVEEEVDERDGNQRSNQPPQDHQNYEHTPPTGYRRPEGDPPSSDLQPLTYLNPPRSERELTTPTSASYPSQAQSPSSGNSPILPRYPQNLSHDSTTSLHPPSTPTHLPPPTTSASSPGNTSRQKSVSPAASASASPHIPTQEYTSERDYTNNLRPPDPPHQYPQPRSRDESPTGNDRRLFSDPATGSVRSLSAFPALLHTSRSLHQERKMRLLLPVSHHLEEPTYAARERISESPSPLEYPDNRRRDDHDNAPPPSQLQQPRRASGGDDRHRDRQPPNTTSGVSQDTTTTSHVYGLRPENFNINANIIPGRGEFRAKDFGVLREESGGSVTTRARTFSGGVPAPPEIHFEFPSASVPSQKRSSIIERVDAATSGTGSIVTAMKTRYSNASGTRSPPPHVGDLPRLHTSVTEIANRYQQPPSQDIAATQSTTHVSSGSITDARESREHQSPRVKQSPLRPLTKTPPPPIARHTSNPTTPEKNALRQHVSSPSQTPTSSPRPLPNPGMPGMRASVDGSEDQRAQWRRVEARERELREREQEITMREREIERDRARLVALQEGLAPSSASANSSEHGGGHSTGDAKDIATSSQSGGQLFPRPRRISFRRSRQDSQPKTPQLRQEQLHPPSSPGNLNPSISNPSLRERHQSNHSYSSPPPSSSSNNQDHGSSSYLSRSTGSPPPQGQQEKKGGWMKRLSMPVGNALPFSLDSSKRNINNSNSSTSSNQNVGVKALGAGIVGGRGINERRNSAVALGIGVRDGRDESREYGYTETSQQGQRVQEQDGGRLGNLGLGLGRKSYDASRSASNLNLGLGRTRY